MGRRQWGFVLETEDKEIVEKIAKLLDVDYSWVVRNALRHYARYGRWSDQTPEEREQFLGLPPLQDRHPRKDGKQ
jgi:hypothetical protein